MKIAIIGYSGSGKSTLAQRLGECYGIAPLHLDRVHFLPGWQERDPSEACAMVKAHMAEDGWIIDGNYTGLLLRERLEQADQILLLKFPRLVCLLRDIRRYRQYNGTVRDSMAEGCPEKLDAEFLWWLLYAGRTKKKRRHFARMEAEYAAKTRVLRNQRQLDALLAEVRARGNIGSQN